MDPIKSPRIDLGALSLPHIKPAALIASERQEAVMREMMSGEATYIALNKAVQELVGAAPKDHDVLVHAFDIFVTKIGLLYPHTLLFRGFDQGGNHTSVVAHFSQVVARVIYLPKKEPSVERVVTGFWVENEKKG